MDEDEARARLRLIEIQKAKLQLSEDPAPEEEDASYGLDQLGTDVLHVAKGAGEAAVDYIDTPYEVRGLVEEHVPEAAQRVGSTVLGAALPGWKLMQQFAPDLLTGKAQPSELPGVKQLKETLASREEGASEEADALRAGVNWGIGGLRKAVLKSADIVPDILMAGGATLGKYVTDHWGGETGGGLTGLLASLIRGKSISRVGEAVKAIEDAAVGTDAFPKAIAAKGEAGTLADVTGDKGLYDLQAGLETSRDTQRQLDAIESARQQQIASEVREPFGDVPTAPAQDAAVKAVGEELENITARTGRQVEAAADQRRPLQKALEESDKLVQRRAADAAAASEVAQETLTESMLPLATSQTLAESGEKMSKVATAAKKVDTDASNIKWDEFKAQGDIEVEPLRQGVSDVFKDMTKRQKEKFNKRHGDLFSWLRKGKEGDLVTSRDVHGDIRDMKAKLRLAYKEGSLNDADKNLEKMIDALDVSLESANDAYAAARQSTRDIYERWGGNLPDALQGPPELFGKNLPLGGELGAYNARILETAAIPGMPEEIVGRLKSLARRSKGGIDAEFMAEYESVMDTMPPEFRKQAEAFIEAGEKAGAASAVAESTVKTATQTTKANVVEREALTKALEAEQLKAAKGGGVLEKAVAKTNLAKYAENPAKTVNSLIEASDAKGLKALYNTMKGMGPEARDAFRSQVGEKLLARLSKGGDAAGVRAMEGLEAPVPDKAFKDFVELRNTLIESDLLDTDMADQIADALRKTTSAKLRADGTSRLFGKTSEGIDAAAGGMAILATSLVPFKMNSLLVTGMFRKFFSKRFQSVSDKSKVHRLINEMMIDPQKYVAGVEKAKNSEDAVRMIMAKVNAAIQTMSAGDEED